MAEIDVDMSAAGQAVQASPGDRVILRLEETPTSGYRWEVDEFDPIVLEAVGDEFIPAAEGAIGAGGTREFRFDVVGGGSSPLRLRRRRPWEDESATVERFEAIVEAEDEAED